MTRARDIANFGDGIATADIDDGAVTTAKIASSTLVGTVSESSGTPTGAIIERGSNANGEYVKYADGTQIATFSVYLDPVSISNGSTLQLSYTFPVSFATSVTTFSGHFTRSDGNPADLIINNGNGAPVVRLTNRSGSTVTRLVPLYYVAVGRWF